jgi:uncharacterized damage-inducible protein DinB
MPFAPDQARLIAEFLLDQFEQEMKTTQSVLAALPAGKEDYSPDARSTPALKLAWHIASADKWFLDSILAGKFEAGESGGVPETIRTGSDAAAWYEANLPASIAALRAAPAETFSRTVDFFGMMQAQGVDFLALALKHSIHHRGQLSAYLRPMGGKVPGIYGPSGDTA